MKNFLILIVCLAVVTNVFARTKNKKSNTIVATVNGVKIYKNQFMKKYTQNKLFVSRYRVTPKKVILDMINRIIGIQNAKKEGLQNNPVVKEKMETVLYHAKISKDLTSKLKKIKVSNKEVEKYYRMFPEYRTAQILFRMKASPQKLEFDAMLKQAKKVYQKLKSNPDDFAKLANKYSQDTSGQVGGDMGFIPAAKYAPEYFSAIRGHKIGFISKPIYTQYGFQIIKILDIKKYKDINKNLYKKFVFDEKRDNLFSQYHRKNRKHAKIWIDKNFIK